MNNKNGFTLAEMLITLAIIGVVAALTISVINNIVQEQQYKTAYKKAFAVASNAVKMVSAQEDSFVPLASNNDVANACTNWTIFSTQFKKAKECIDNDANLCWDMAGEKSGSAPYSGSNGFIDTSGIS